jgi:hypothetical protein
MGKTKHRAMMLQSFFVHRRKWLHALKQALKKWMVMLLLLAKQLVMLFGLRGYLKWREMQVYQGKAFTKHFLQKEIQISAPFLRLLPPSTLSSMQKQFKIPVLLPNKLIQRSATAPADHSVV